MGVLIESAVAIAGGHGPGAASSLALTDRAVRDCLREAGRDAGELGLLISTGIYHDRNLAEPALASLIQEDVGANPGHPPVGGHGTFSFDLVNGTCGVLSAAHLVDGFMRSRAVDLGMVVAGDANPGASRGFTFRRSGAAMLLRWDEGDTGFQAFHFRTFPEYSDLFVSTLGWDASQGRRLPFRHHGQNVLDVIQRAGYLEQSATCSVESTQEFLAGNGMTARAVDVLVAVHTSRGFADLVAEGLGIPRAAVVRVPRSIQDAHTALPIAALAQAHRAGNLDGAQQVLVVTAGAGITVGLALYRGA